MSKFKINKFVTKKIEETDYKYKSTLVAKMINRVMKDGKKQIATKLVYSAMQKLFDELKDQGKSALDLFNESINNTSPPVELKSRRIGGATYQIPVPVSEKRKKFLAIYWIWLGAKEKNGVNFDVALFNAFLDSYNMSGSAIKRKNDNISRAKDNQAFSHYRW